MHVCFDVANAGWRFGGGSVVEVEVGEVDFLELFPGGNRVGNALCELLQCLQRAFGGALSLAVVNVPGLCGG